MAVEKPELNKIVRRIALLKKTNRGSGNHIHDCEVLYTCFQQCKQGPGRWKLRVHRSGSDEKWEKSDR